jgi:DUF4097 and DUF4098 domain-containing protein YvlB
MFFRLGALTSAVICTGCVEVVAIDGPRYVDRVERQFRVKGKPDITLSTFDGAIEVRPWGRSEVQVVVERRAPSREAAEDIEVEAEQNDEQIRVAVRRRRDRARDWTFGGRSASLVVNVPASADLAARSGDGSLDVEGIAGRIDLRTGDGSIRGRRLSGELKVATGDGSIRISDADGTLRAQTGDGSINVGGALSDVTVHTGDGTVTLSSSGGSAAQGEWSISTGDGSVTLELPEDFNADLDARTGDGQISLDNLRVSNVMGRMAKNRLRGQLGSGGRLLRIRTGDGSITLRAAGTASF